MSHRAILFVPVVVGLLAATAAPAAPPHHGPPAPSTETLIETTTTVLGQPFYYPSGTAKITSLIVTIPPHGTLPLHQHPVPLFAYVLQGAVTVDYGSEGTRTYRRGDTLVEAFDYPHRARNAGKGVCRILAVYAGADGIPDTEILE